MQDPNALAQVALDTAQWLRYQAEIFGTDGVEVSGDILVSGRSGAQGLGQPSPSSGAASTVVAPVGNAAEILQAIRAELGDCSRCKLCKGRTSLVFGIGNPQARLMFIGEGPGRDEDLQGEPFVGAAGRLLNRMIVAMGLQRPEVYIANVVKCRPPRNRDPEPDEVAACEPFLRQQIAAIKPTVLVALGRYAAHTLLRTTTPISVLRGRWSTYEGIALMPTFHPAYLLHNPGDKRLVWQDLQQVMSRLNQIGVQEGAC